METIYKAWHLALVVLEIFGLFSIKDKNKISIFAYLYAALLAFSECIVTMQFFYINGNIFKFVDNSQAFGAFLQHIAKISVLVYQRREFKDLLDDTKRFWKTDSCEEAVRIELNNLSVKSLMLQKLFLGCIIFSVFLLAMYGFLIGSLPLGVWAMEGHEILYGFARWSETVMVLVAGFVVGAFDCNFLSFCAQTVIQFRILCYSITKLNFSNVETEVEERQRYEKIKLHVKQHNFLLRFLGKLQAFYSPVLFVQYITISPLICGELFALFESTSPMLLIRHSIVCLSLIMQLGLYCIAADYVTTEALTVSGAIYDSDWYSTSYSTLRKPVTLVMQKSQQVNSFTAGGLFTINSEAILTVLKMSWSACTLMRVLKEK